MKKKKVRYFFIQLMIIIISSLITFEIYQDLRISNNSSANKYSVAIKFNDDYRINRNTHSYILGFTDHDFSKENYKNKKTYRYRIEKNNIIFDFSSEFRKLQKILLYERIISEQNEQQEEEKISSIIDEITVNNQKYDFKVLPLDSFLSAQNKEKFDITEIEFSSPVYSAADTDLVSDSGVILSFFLIALICTAVSVLISIAGSKLKPSFTLNVGMIAILFAVMMIHLMFVYFVVRDFSDRSTIMISSVLFTFTDFLFVFLISLLVSGHRIVYTAVIATVLTVLIGQIVCITNSCSYISPVSLGNINIDNISTLYNGGNEKFILVYFLLIALLLTRYRKTKIIDISRKVWLITASAVIFFGTLSFLFNSLPDGSKIEKFQSPVIGLFKVKLNKHFPNFTEKFSIVYSSVLQKYKTDDFNYRETFYNDSVFEKTLQYPQLKKVSKPNLIIFFTESFTAELMDSYRTSRIELMPFMSNLHSVYSDKQITLVRNYFNHTATTIRGIRSQLFSGFQKDAVTEKKITDSNSLTEILKSHGYQTFFIIPESGDTFLTMVKVVGFENVLPSNSNTVGTNHNVITDCISAICDDEVLFQRFKETVKLIKDKKVDSELPFFVALYNMGTHMSMDGKYKFRDGANSVLNRFFTLDHNLKDFIDFYYEELADDTILIITADHSIIPGEPGTEALDFDKRFITNQVPMFIFQPYWDLPRELDLHEIGGYMNGLALAPTVLHLMNINDPNYFLGCSIFERMCRRTLDLSRYGWYTDKGFFYEEGFYENGKKYKPEKIDSFFQKKHPDIDFSLINAYREGFISLFGE